MRRHHAFTLTDLLAATAAVAVLLTLTAATLAEDETIRQKMQNSTQLRGIHQGMFVYANSNREFFPGMDSRGRMVENSDDTTGNSGAGDTTEARLWILMEGDFFTPEYAIAPVDRRAVPLATPEDAGAPLTPVTFDNYSYAMLDIDADAVNRRAEWTQSTNSQAVVMSDRNCSDINEQDPFSIWEDGEWQGGVLWNDNHVAFETDHVLETRYGNGTHNIDNATGKGTDALFTEDNTDGDDALTTFSRDEDGNERAIWDISEPEEE